MTDSANSWARRARACCAAVGVRANVVKGPPGRLTFYYPLATDSIRHCDGDESGRRTRPDLANGQMKHGGGGRRDVSLAPRQQGGIVGQLAGADLPRCDPAQAGMRLRQLLALAVLAAG